MTQTTNRFFDEVARLMNDAAGVAQGVRREFETLVRAQGERILRDLDVVKREEFEAVKEMARVAPTRGALRYLRFLVFFPPGRYKAARRGPWPTNHIAAPTPLEAGRATG